MNPNDHSDGAVNLPLSNRIPLLPPGTPQQIMQPQGLDRLGLGSALSACIPSLLPPGLASGLGASTMTHLMPNELAGALLGEGTPAPKNYDPRLMDITRDPATPTFQTANGTLIEMNKPSPATILPWGDGLDRLIKFADGTGLGKVVISGGSETPGHTPHTAHALNQAIDVSVQTNPKDIGALQSAALTAGYNYGFYEPNLGHWHFQVGPGNILNAENHDLRKGPMHTVYTKKQARSAKNGGN